MTEPLDPLLAALAEAERDLDRRYPGDWEAVVAGERSAADVAAARAALDPPDEHAVFADMFSKPASDAELEALIDRAAAVLAAPAAATPTAVTTATAAPVALADAPPPAAPIAAPGTLTTGAAPSASPGAAAAPPAPTVAPVIPLAARRRTFAVLGAALAIAAAVLLWRFTAVTVALDSYALTVRNETVQAMRSTDPAPDVPRYRPDTELDWVISPERAGADPVELRIIARAADGRAELFSPPFTRSPAGALRIRGRLDAAVSLPPGRWQLTLVVAAPGQAERLTDVTRALADGRAVEVRPPLELEILAP